tara:strand:- start:8 stop:409 length:402 start_codon:yes stop_codon:yes gene_type:complete
MNEMQGAVTLDDIFNKLRLEPNMGPDQKQTILNQILDDASRGVPPSMKYFAPPMNIPMDRYAPAPDAPNPNMFRRRYPGDDIPDRPGTIVEEINPFMTRSQVETEMELDKIGQEMKAKGQRMRNSSPLNSLRR